MRPIDPFLASTTDCTYRGTSMVESPDSRLDSAGIIHTVYVDGQTGNVYYQTFSTLTDLWGVRVVIGTGARVGDGSELATLRAGRPEPRLQRCPARRIRDVRDIQHAALHQPSRRQLELAGRRGERDQRDAPDHGHGARRHAAPGMVEQFPGGPLRYLLLALRQRHLDNSGAGEQWRCERAVEWRQRPGARHHRGSQRSPSGDIPGRRSLGQ